MARAKRQVSESGIYKIYLRGNDISLFKSDADYDEFISLMGKYFSEGDDVLRFSLDADNAEIVVKIDGDSISMAMKPLLTSYARYYNKTYARTGKVFYDRYKSEPIKEAEAKQTAESVAVRVRNGAADEIKSVFALRADTVKTAEKVLKPHNTDVTEEKAERQPERSMPTWLL